MGERLLSVYIDANRKPVMGVPTKFAKWWLPMCRNVVRIFKVNRESNIYKIFKDKFGYSSQYGRK